MKARLARLPFPSTSRRLLFSGLLGAAVLAASLPNVMAQDRPPGDGNRPRGGEGERGERGGRGEGGFVRMNPVVAALDTNGDGIIDETELANAVASLKKLDKNGDGKLTQDELRPAGMGGRGPGGPGGANPEELVTRLMQFDKNGDGKLAKDELPERMQGLLDRADTDKDGFLSKDEIRKSAESRGRGGEGRPRGERSDRRDEDGGQRRPTPPADK